MGKGFRKFYFSVTSQHQLRNSLPLGLPSTTRGFGQLLTTTSTETASWCGSSTSRPHERRRWPASTWCCSRVTTTTRWPWGWSAVPSGPTRPPPADHISSSIECSRPRSSTRTGRSWWLTGERRIKWRLVVVADDWRLAQFRSRFFIDYRDRDFISTIDILFRAPDKHFICLRLWMEFIASIDRF